MHPHHSVEHADALWKAMDRDHSGSLDADEFCRICQFFDVDLQESTLLTPRKAGH
jgi:hypothetical protein